MRTDDLAPALAVVRRSRLAAIGRRASDWCHAVIAESIAATAWRRLRAGIRAIDPADRFRLAGILVLTATAVQYVLVQWVPPMERPGTPALLRVVIGIGALLLVTLAPRLAGAWSGSRLARLAERRR